MMEARVAGIPCLVDITSYNRIKPWSGSVYTCPSDQDWYGYTEMEYVICDRRGRPADWLEKKLTKAEQERLEARIAEYMESE